MFGESAPNIANCAGAGAAGRIRSPDARVKLISPRSACKNLEMMEIGP
jgi:hypothetical protein